jgi:hypothetical protein
MLRVGLHCTAAADDSRQRLGLLGLYSARGTPFAVPRRAPGTNEPRATTETVLHQVVRAHLDGFLAATAAATDGAGLPPSSRASSVTSSAAARARRMWASGEVGDRRAPPPDAERARGCRTVQGRAQRDQPSTNAPLGEAQ